MDKVVGTGIGLSGLIEPGTGTCRYTPLFGWTDVQVATPIAKRLDRPVLVENDCNALTVAEQWFGRGHGVDDFVVIAVGEGVGAGIVIDGNLYCGADGAAGEIGHEHCSPVPTEMWTFLSGQSTMSPGLEVRCASCWANCSARRSTAQLSSRSSGPSGLYY